MAKAELFEALLAWIAPKQLNRQLPFWCVRRENVKRTVMFKVGNYSIAVKLIPAESVFRAHGDNGIHYGKLRP